MTPIDVNAIVGGSFFQNLFTRKFLMKMKLNNGKGKVLYYLKVMKTGLQHPCRTFVLTYINLFYYSHAREVRIVSFVI